MPITIFGMPNATAFAFALTALAGCFAAIHYVIVHILLGKPIQEGDPR